MHRNEERVETKLRRIAEKANSETKLKFTSLFHLMNEELLLGCFERLRNNAASGMDGVTNVRNLERVFQSVLALDLSHRIFSD